MELLVSSPLGRASRWGISFASSLDQAGALRNTEDCALYLIIFVAMTQKTQPQLAMKRKII